MCLTLILLGGLAVCFGPLIIDEEHGGDANSASTNQELQDA